MYDELLRILSERDARQALIDPHRGGLCPICGGVANSSAGDSVSCSTGHQWQRPATIPVRCPECSDINGNHDRACWQWQVSSAEIALLAVKEQIAELPLDVAAKINLALLYIECRKNSLEKNDE